MAHRIVGRLAPTLSCVLLCVFAAGGTIAAMRGFLPTAAAWAIGWAGLVGLLRLYCRGRRPTTLAGAAWGTAAGLLVGGHATAAAMPGDMVLLAAAVATAMTSAIVIDGRRRLLGELRRSELQHRSMIDLSSDAIVQIDLGGRCVFASLAFERLLGIAPHALIGRNVGELVHPDDAARVWREHGVLAHERDRTAVIQYRARRVDGSWAWLETHARALPSPDGVVRGLVCVVRDVSVRLAEEQATAEASARLQEDYRLLTMAEAVARVGHWRIALPVGTLFWSAEVYRIYGIAPGNPPCLDNAMAHHHPDDRAAVRAKLDRAMAGGAGFIFRTRILRGDGMMRHVSCIGQVETTADGVPVGVIGVVQDITDQIENERALVEARDAACRAAAAKDAFLATMSHELRTPMTAIVGMLELLAEDRPAVARADAIATINQSATTLMRVLDDVLDLEKIGSGALLIESMAFDLAEVVNGAVELFRPSAAAKGIALACDMAPGMEVRGDPSRIRQIVGNFLSNAVKFTQAGTIRVAVHAADAGQTRIEVLDSGIGIAAETLEKLFVPFAQADDSITRRFGGTGLGLAISRRLAEAMGGTAGATSRPGVGSCFWVELPLTAVGDAGHPVAPVAELSSTELPAKVLVVDDTATTRIVTEAHLAALGCRARGVGGGVAALAAMAEERFDVVLLDSAMPGIDGATTARLARMLPGGRDVRLLGFTAHPGADHAAMLVAAGMDDVLVKPFRRAQLQAMLGAAERSGDSEPAAGDTFAVLPPPVRAQIGAAVAGDLWAEADRVRHALAERDAAALGAAASRLRRVATMFGLTALGDAAIIADELAGIVPPDELGFLAALIERLIGAALPVDLPVARAMDVAA